MATGGEVIRRTFAISVNPIPWVAPGYSCVKVAKAMRPVGTVSPQLRDYKQFVADELRRLGAEVLPPPYLLTFYFWRQREQYVNDNGRKVTKNKADVTNLQKALEDALQGILIDNDRNVLGVFSAIIEQEVDTKPGVVIEVTSGLGRYIAPEHVVTAYQGLSATPGMNLEGAEERNRW